MRYSEVEGEWMPMPLWVRFFLSLGYTWPRIDQQLRRICLVSMPCDSPAAGLIALGAMVHDLGDPLANDVDAHTKRLLNYARQYLEHCKLCTLRCHPELKRCGYTKQATGRLRSPLLRGTVQISGQTDFDAGELKWLQGNSVVTRKRDHLKDYHIEDEPPCEWNDAVGELSPAPYELLFRDAAIISDNLRRSYGGLCLAGRGTGQGATRSTYEQVHIGDAVCEYSLSEILAIPEWSDCRISRLAYFNSRTRRMDRRAASPNLVIADGDSAFLRAFDHSEFQRADILAVVHRSLDRDRLEAVGTKMLPSQWFEPDTDRLCELPPKPKGVSIVILKSRTTNDV
jgi:hypothetical protein